MSGAAHLRIVIALLTVGGIGALAPNKKSELARLGIRAMMAGTMANLMSASLVGIMLK